MLDEIKNLDVVELVDGRQVAILEVFTEPTLGYLCEDVQAIKDHKDFNDVVFVVKPNQIKQIIWTSPN